MPKENKVIVEGANMIIRHTKDKPNRSAGAKRPNNVHQGRPHRKGSASLRRQSHGGLPECKRPTRVGYEYREGEEKLSRRKYPHLQASGLRQSRSTIKL